MSYINLRRTQEIYSELERIHSTRVIRDTFITQRSVRLRIAKRIQREIDDLRKTYSQMENSALKIQRFFKGVLIRRDFAHLYVKKDRKKVQFKIQDSSEYTNDLYIKSRNIWINTIIIKIQRFFRRCLFYSKIKRIERVYKYHLQVRRYRNMQKLRRTLIVFVNKIRKETLIRNIWKENKLKEIREKLALCSIRNFFRSSKLNVFGVVRRIRKYKKRAKYRQQIMDTDDFGFVPKSLNVLLKDIPQANANKLSNTIPTENTQNTQNTQSIQSIKNAGNTVDPIPQKSRRNYSRKKIVSQDQLIEQIKSGYISYNITQYKKKKFFPILDFDFEEHTKINSFQNRRNSIHSTCRNLGKRNSNRIIMKSNR